MAKNEKNVWWLWQSRIVFTQTNAGGGAIKVDYAIPAGTVARNIFAIMINSGTNTANIYLSDEDNAIQGTLAAAASAAASNTKIPGPGTSTTTITYPSGNLPDTTRLIVGPGQKLAFEQTAAGLQNDTTTIAISMLLSTATEPTISKARSTNAADVTQGTDSISDDNDLQAVIL